MLRKVPFESTQSINERVQKTISAITWGDMPEDGLVLKEYEAPIIKKDDAPPLQKPNIKSTLRQFWELMQETHEEENNTLMKKVDQMEIEPHAPIDDQPEAPVSIIPKKPTPPTIHEPAPVQPTTQASQFNTERKKRMILTKQKDTGNAHHHVLNTQGTQNTQNIDYVQKLANALEPSIIRGKSKHSQRFPYASSSTSFLDKKKKQAAELSQISTAMGNYNEDIDDLEDIQEEGVFVQGIGHKKLKLEVDNENSNRGQVLKTLEKYCDFSASKGKPPGDGKDSLKDKDNTREKGLQDTLEKAIRRASNQPPTKWLIKVLSYKTSKGIHTVEFLCISPNSEGNTTSYAIINPGKQYYVQNIVPDKKYFFVNPRPIVQKEVNNKKVYYVDKIEEAVN